MTILRIRKDSVLFGHPEVIKQEINGEIFRELPDAWHVRFTDDEGNLASLALMKKHWERIN